MTRRTALMGPGLLAGVTAAVLLASAIPRTVAAVPCDESGQKAESKAPAAAAAKPAQARPAGLVAPARPRHAKAPPPAAEELPPFFGPRGALAPHVV